MTEGKVDVELAIRFSLATRQQQIIKDYIERGRLLEQFTDEEVREHFVSAFGHYSANPDDDLHKTLFDHAWAELELRKIEPPFARVNQDLAALGQKTAAWFNAMPEDRQNQIGEEIVLEFLEAQRRKN